mmetsp:Transcript_18728/g.33934  ORF Transcript_18728/g.33934 Transcript_18728/m.33934 type:complete len:726 (-) Transcript_18728:19-2196(-)
MTQRLSLQILRVTFPSLRSLHSLVCEVKLRSSVQTYAHPFDEPVVYREAGLTLEDAVELRFFADDSPLGIVVLAFKEHFQFALEGEFDKWVQVKTLDRVRDSSSMRSLYDDSTPQRRAVDDSPERHPLIRVRLSIEAPESPATPEQEEFPPEEQVLEDPVSEDPGYDEPAYEEPVLHATDCPRCAYLEKLTLTQQNELKCIEESEAAFAQIAKYLVADDNDYYARDLALEDLGLDTDALNKSQAGGLNAQEAEHLRTLVVGLNEKLRSLQLLQREVQNMRGKLQDSFNARRVLQASIETTTKQLKEQADKQDQVHAQLIRDREKAVEGLRQQHLQWKDLCQKEEALESQLALANAELQKHSAEAENFAEMQAHISRLQAELKLSEQQREQLRSQYLQSLKEFESRYQELQESINDLTNNKSALQVSLREASQELAEQRKRNDALAQENLKLRSDISSMEAEIESISDESKQLNSAHKLALEHEAAAERLQEALHKSSQSFEANLQELKNHNEHLLQEKVDLDTQLTNLENELMIKADQVNELNRSKFQLAAERHTLQQLLVVRNDLEQINTELKTKADLNANLQQQLLKELLTVSNYLLALSEQTFTSHRSVLALKDQLQEKEEEAQRLQQLLESMKSKRALYIPAQKDLTDQALASFINSRPEELQVPFVRESAGRYKFGQRDVAVSITDDKLTVKVGGGWLLIEDFLEAYEALEAEKAGLGLS